MEVRAFTVRGQVVGHGTETLPDGTTRRYAKVKVLSVVDDPRGGDSTLRVTFTPRDAHDEG